MMSLSFLENLVPWMLQVLVIGTAGAVLPMLFRILHPRSQVIYCHALLAACLVLPMIQPWHHPVITTPGVQKTVESVSGAAYAPSPVILSPQPAPRPWSRILLFVLAAGITGRLCWTLAGLWQLRRLRTSAKPLYPIPESIMTAYSLVKADAVFGTTEAGAGPLTFGFFKRIILLPESFNSLDEQAQLGIACHELLHARRNDWLITLFEELAAALFWFHPAIWWVLAQTRLAREQLVDAEVVRLTAARESYVNALLTVAGARPTLDLAPAPLFLRRRHLLQRMHFLLTEVSMSRVRLFSSYASIAAILALAGWIAVISFPLVGLAEIRPAVPHTQPPAQEQSPGYVVNRPPASYPADAIRKRIEGTVVIELTFNVNGDIVDSRVLSGPEELRRAGLESALKGNYNINVARTLQVVVDFKLPTPGQRGGVRNGVLGGVLGGVLSPEGQPGVPPVGPPPPPPPPPPFPGDNLSAIIDAIEIRGLSDPQLSALHQRVDAFVGKPRNSVDIQQAISESGAGSPYSISNSKTADGKVTLVLAFGTEAIFGVPGVRTIRTPFGDATIQTPFGATGARGGTATPFADSTGPAPTVFGADLNSSDIQPISKVDPIYPPLARQARIQGPVVLSVSIDTAGKVSNIKVITGHPLLIQSAIEAVKQWVFPAQADTASTTVAVNFYFK
jgi:TonB family protein